MAKRCEVCNKGPVVGRNVSHAHNVTPRRFEPNLQRVRAMVNGGIKRLRVCTRCLRSGKVTKAGEPVKLTAQEYKLLSYLMHHKGKVVSRTELIEHIYDQDFDRDSNTIEVFVTRIRKKLGPDVITTIRGLGYSLEEPVS